MIPKRAAVAAAAAALALSACGEDLTAEQGDAVERVVRDFALADGREACDLMTIDGLERVYGGDDAQPAYWNCVEASDRFEGARIEIDETEVTSRDKAYVKASTPDDERSFTVRLRRVSREWLINEIVEA